MVTDIYVVTARHSRTGDDEGHGIYDSRNLADTAAKDLADDYKYIIVQKCRVYKGPDDEIAHVYSAITLYEIEH